MQHYFLFKGYNGLWKPNSVVGILCLGFEIDSLFETCFLSYVSIERFTEMFWKYFDAARRLGNSEGSASEVMLAGKLTRS